MVDNRASRLAAALAPLIPRFREQTALIFAPGPSLPVLWNGRTSTLPKIAVNDAWKLVADADVCYGTDAAWWMHHRGLPDFKGVKIGYEGPGPAGVLWLRGTGATGYDPKLGQVRHGQGSGYAAVHLAAQLGSVRIVLVGFDCRAVEGKEHWFGSHPREIRKPMPFAIWIERFPGLIKELAGRGVQVFNATPDSRLTIPTILLEDVLNTSA